MPSYQKKTVKIPVEYELGNIDKQIKAMRASLDTVKPESAAYKELNSILSKIQKEFTSISAEAQGTFGSQSQINSFNKKIKDMSNNMSLFASKFEKVANIDFGSNFLPKELVNNIKDTTQEIARMEAAMANIKKQSFSGAVKSSSELVNTLSKLKLTADNDPTVIISKLEAASKKSQASIAKSNTELEAQREKTQKLRQEYEALNSVRNAKQGQINTTQSSIKTLESNISKQEAANEKNRAKAIGDATAAYDAQLTKLKEVKKALSGHMTSEQRQQSPILGQVFSQGSGGINENKTNLINYLKKNFTIDGAVLGEIEKYTMPQLRQLANNLIEQVLAQKEAAIQNIKVDNVYSQDSLNKSREELERLKQELEKYKSELAIADQDVNAKSKEYNASSTKTSKMEDDLKALIQLTEEYARALDEIKKAQEGADLAATNSSEGANLEALRAKLKGYLDNVDELIAKNKEAARTNAGNKDSLDGMAKAADGASAELDRLQNAQQRLQNMKDVVKQWLGFTEVINLSKRAISGMISHIKELDDVMTQIAIVTDFTQDDLWNQMSTYSDMARQYGVSIKGVYEVSQLFYQQGMVAEYLTFFLIYSIISLESRRAFK